MEEKEEEKEEKSSRVGVEVASELLNCEVGSSILGTSALARVGVGYFLESLRALRPFSSHRYHYMLILLCAGIAVWGNCCFCLLRKKREIVKLRNQRREVFFYTVQLTDTDFHNMFELKQYYAFNRITDFNFFWKKLESPPFICLPTFL